MSRHLFLDALTRTNTVGPRVFGTGTSIACRELMDKVGVRFPDAHLDARQMADLAEAGHTLLGMDVAMPLFSTCHESAAMDCDVDWGGANAMPYAKPIYRGLDDISIPDDLLTRPGCRVPLEAIAMLKRRLGDSAAVCGKAFGGWTLGYHLFGVENFLIGTLDDPDQTRRIVKKLSEITRLFARAQVEAGADCILLADHATRDLCSPEAYRDFLADLHAQFVRESTVPVILHICGNTSDRIGMIAETGMNCFHWDTKTGTPMEVRRLAGERMALMGGVSNYTLLRGTKDEVAAQAIAAAAGGIDVVGPECAIPLGTPLENLCAIAGVGRR